MVEARLSEITHVPISASIDGVVAILKRDGAVIVEDMLPEQAFQHLLADLRPHLDRSPSGTPGQVGEHTRGCGGVIAKSPHAAELLTNAMLLGVSERILVSDQPYAFWNDGVERLVYPRLQLSVSQAIEILPGERAQPLHRDDVVNHRHHPGPETQVLIMYALADFTEENGATCVVLGSHLWDKTRAPKTSECVQAHMRRNSGLIYLGSVFHGGGANRTPDQPRPAIRIGLIPGHLRQEENQYLAVPIEIAKRYPPKVRALLGYAVSPPACGWVDDPDFASLRGDLTP